ncbi:MAG: phosphatase PAP2 family protein, partial [Dehalococcoidia bacterium]|nr:phosphatase PAP2 family protein [Dehalococcoidia bacterium]
MQRQAFNTLSSASRREGRFLGSLVRRPWPEVLRDISITAALMLTYFLIRGLRPDAIEDSVGRSLYIIKFEQSVGIFQEVRWQEIFLPYDHLMTVANFVYAWLHYPVLLAIALWLVIRDGAKFHFLRNVMMVSAFIGIVCYWLLPAAPPRLLEDYGFDFGFRDTVHGATSNVGYFQPGPFVNDYAAIPSFHFGWIALASAALWITTNSRLVRAFAVFMSVLMWWAVTVTGNHFFFDMIMGGLVVGFSWAFVAWTEQLNFQEFGQKMGLLPPDLPPP